MIALAFFSVIVMNVEVSVALMNVMAVVAAVILV